MPRNPLRQGALDRTLIALSDPTRRHLMARIARRPQRATDACRGLQVSRPAVSKHLSVLRRAGLVSVEVRGRERVYHLTAHPRGLVQARAYLEQVSAFWDRALGAFKAFAEAESER